MLKALRAEGKTVVVVHHDLATVQDYFENVFPINTRKVAEALWRRPLRRYLQAAWGRLATAQIEQIGVQREWCDANPERERRSMLIDALFLQLGDNAT